MLTNKLWSIGFVRLTSDAILQPFIVLFCSYSKEWEYCGYYPFVSMYFQVYLATCYFPCSTTECSLHLNWPSHTHSVLEVGSCKGHTCTLLNILCLFCSVACFILCFHIWHLYMNEDVIMLLDMQYLYLQESVFSFYILFKSKFNTVCHRNLTIIRNISCQIVLLKTANLDTILFF